MLRRHEAKNNKTRRVQTRLAEANRIETRKVPSAGLNETARERM
jgi:hypothetical protein